MADDHSAAASNTPSAPSDPTPFIRTYAKDVARLTGTQAKAVGPAKDAPTAGVQFAEVDMSQAQGVRADAASAPSLQHEVLSITKNDTADNLNLASPNMTPDRRNEILSRLRSHVQSPPPSAPSLTAVPMPAAPAPIVAPTTMHVPSSPAPAQAFAPKPAPVAPPPPPLTPSPAPGPAPASASKPAPKPHKEFHLFGRHEPKTEAQPAANLHTFKSDFADHIDKQQATTFSVLAAQGDAPDTRKASPQPVKLKTKNTVNIPVLLSAVALIVVGIAALGGTYWFVAMRSHVAAPFAVPSLIFADKKVELPADAPSLAQAITQVAQEPSAHGDITVTYLVTTSNGKQGIIKTPQPGGALIKQVFIGAPDILLRNIDDSSTAGVINAGAASAPFFIVHTSSYERTFAGMLGWEPTIGTNLAALYPAPATAPVGTSTAPRIVAAPHFSDAIVANHDVRVLKDGNGQTILLYGYRDKQTLIIAKDEAAFSAILVRLSAATGN